VTEASGIPVGAATDAANVPETVLAGAALADIPPSVRIEPGVPVVADRGSDSDALRVHLADEGFTLVLLCLIPARSEPVALQLLATNRARGGTPSSDGCRDHQRAPRGRDTIAEPDHGYQGMSTEGRAAPRRIRGGRGNPCAG
jgi:hypothetical protein